jgi:hypothetical protein
MYNFRRPAEAMHQTVQAHPPAAIKPAGQPEIDVLLRYGDSPVAVILAIAFLIAAITGLIKVLVPVMLRK